jgi:hypothetical protein
MEGNTLQTQTHALPNPGRVRVQTNRCSNNPGGHEPTYWGVLCRSCIELVAFNTYPYLTFGSRAASMHPGTIRCAHGHVHIYFPRDFQFFFSDIPVADAVMQGNREAYRATNSSLQAFPSELDGSEELDAPYAPSDSLRGLEACLESLVPETVRPTTGDAVNIHLVAWTPPTVKPRDPAWFAAIRLFFGMSSSATTR